MSGEGAMRRLRSVRGSGTVLVLAGVGLLAMVAATVVVVGTAVVARHRAQSAADLAALAAAAHALDGEQAACSRAAAVARAGGAELVACRLTGDVVDVVTTVRPRGLAGRVGVARGRARAGPASGVPESGTSGPVSMGDGLGDVRPGVHGIGCMGSRPDTSGRLGTSRTDGRLGRVPRRDVRSAVRRGAG